MFVAVVHIPAEIFIPITYFLDTTNTSNMIFLSDNQSHALVGAYSRGPLPRGANSVIYAKLGK